MTRLFPSASILLLAASFAASACSGDLARQATPATGNGSDAGTPDAGVGGSVIVDGGTDATDAGVNDEGDAIALAPLVLSPPTGTVRAGGTLKIAALGKSGATFRLTTNHSGGSIDASTGVYVAGSIANEVDTVTVTGADGSIGTVQIEVSPVVSITPATANAAVGGALTFQGSGGSGSGFVATLLSNRSGATLDATSGLYTAGATPNVQDVVQIVDGAGNVATALVNVGSTLTLSPASPAVPPLGSETFAAPGGATFTLATNLSGATIDPTSGSYTAGPFADVGDVVLVTDGNGNAVSRRIVVGPGVSLSPSPVSIVPGGARSFAASGGSATGFHFAFASNNSGGTIDAVTGAYVAGAQASVTDTVMATDSLGNRGTQSITVGTALGFTATPNAAPPPSGAVTFSASGGFKPYTFSLASNLSGGRIDASTGAYQAGATGGVSDSVQVTDGEGDTEIIAVTVGPGVTLTPAGMSLAAGATQTFGAAGGSDAGFAFSLLTNASGGSIDSATGLYTAGPGTGVDTIEAIDSLANVGTITVSVTAAPAVSAVSPSSGPAAGGTTVTLAGTHLTGATSVAFGSTPATNVVVVSDTQITATAPAHAAGVVDVTVTTAGGTTSAGVADHFTYASPKPSVTGVSPSSGPRGGGTAITITGTNFTNATYVRWTGAPGGQGTQAQTTTFTIVSDTEITLTTPANVFGPLLDDVHVGSAAGESLYNVDDEYQWQ